MRLLFINILFCISLSAQVNVHKLEPVKKSNNIYQFNPPSNQSVFYYFDKDKNVNAYSYDPGKKVDVIVQFKEEPYLVKKFIRGENISESHYKNNFVNFRTDLSDIALKLNKKLKKINVQFEVTKEFHKLFNGVATSVSPALFNSISELPYVKKIFLNYKVKASLQESVHLIGADSLWVKYNTKGAGILVGVLDTGIDYMHPFLGGGFGPDFRVIGGYDFINDDADPMDDNFHGTHVAGIIGANGDTLKGVAPEVSFLAVKILDEYGSGNTATIIEGLEYIMDPNGDGVFDDVPDIINLSLGGPGGPDSPLSIAVDNAVEMGITVCVSAGNSGKYFTITSPGSAEEVITVGASDKSDKLASFSSKGPNKVSFSIKPDLVAPGVGILSTFPNGAVDILNGTSMASPHVAGLAALLLSIHPDWTPKNIKSALKTSAVDLGEDVMSQGAGRIDAIGAAEENVFIYPSDLSFGIDQTNQNLWEVSKTLKFYNLSDQNHSYSAVFNNTSTGIKIAIDPQNFSINSNDSTEVTITLSVDNSLVPYMADQSLTYGGTTLFYNNTDTLKIPWAFVKASRLVVNTDLPTPSINISSKNNYFYSNPTGFLDLYRYEFILPKDIYDIVTLFDSGIDPLAIVLNEKINVDGYQEMNIYSSDAANQLILQGVDEQNRKLVDRNNLVRAINVFFPDSDRYATLSTHEYINSPQIYVNNFSKFELHITEYQQDIASEKKIRILRHKPIKGMNGDLTLTNSPGDFLNQKLSYQIPPTQNNHWLSFSYTTRFGPLYADQNQYMFIVPPGTQITGNSWEGNLFITNEDPNYILGTTSNMVVSPDENFITNNWFFTPFVQAFDDKIGFFGGDMLGGYNELNYFKPSGSVSRFGTTPVFSNSFHINNVFGKTNISITFPPAVGLQSYGALGELREIESNNAQYEIYNDKNEVINSGKIYDFSPIDVEPGKYSIKITDDNFYLNKVKGHFELMSHFDLNSKDPNPPEIGLYRIMNPDSLIVNSVKQGENALIEFSLADIRFEKIGLGVQFFYHSVQIDSTKLFYRVHGTEDWQIMPFTAIKESPGNGVLYSAEWINNLSTDSSAVDLMIQAQDSSGNSIQFVSKPAFLVGDKLVSIDEDENDIVKSVPETYSLSANYPNPFNPETNIQFTIPKKGLVTLKIYNLLGQEVKTLVQEIKNAGEYSVKFNGVGLSSGVYFYRIISGNFIETKKMLLLK